MSQREFPRFRVDVAAEVLLGREVVEAMMQDVSAGGAALVLDRPVAENSPLDLALFLVEDGFQNPDEAPFRVKATVIWCADREDGAGHTAGVRFDALDRAQRSHLDHFLARLEENVGSTSPS